MRYWRARPAARRCSATAASRGRTAGRCRGGACCDGCHAMPVSLQSSWHTTMAPRFAALPCSTPSCCAPTTILLAAHRAIASRPTHRPACPCPAPQRADAAGRRQHPLGGLHPPAGPQRLLHPPGGPPPLGCGAWQQGGWLCRASRLGQPVAVRHRARSPQRHVRPCHCGTYARCAGPLGTPAAATVQRRPAHRSPCPGSTWMHPQGDPPPPTGPSPPPSPPAPPPHPRPCSATTWCSRAAQPTCWRSACGGPSSRAAPRPERKAAGQLAAPRRGSGGVGAGAA